MRDRDKRWKILRHIKQKDVVLKKFRINKLEIVVRWLQKLFEIHHQSTTNLTLINSQSTRHSLDMSLKNSLEPKKCWWMLMNMAQSLKN